MRGAPIETGGGVTLERQVLFALREDHLLFAKLTLGVVGYSAGHAFLALTAGAIAEAWARTPFDHPALPGIGSIIPSVATASYVGLGAAIVKAGTGALLSESERRLGASVSGRLRRSLVERFLRNGTGMPAPNALSLIAVRLREIEGATVEGVLGRARSLAQLLPLAVCLVALSPMLSLGAALAMSPFVVVLSRLRGRMRQSTARAQATVEALEREVDELVRNVDLFRAYGAGDRAVDALNRSASTASSEASRLDGARALASGFNEVMAALAVVGAVALAGRFGLPPGGAALVPFAAVFFMSYRPLRDLGDARAWVERGSIALDAVRAAASGGATDVLATNGAGSGGEPALVHAGANRTPEIVLTEFGGAHHGAPGTFRVEPGKIVCVVGPTGAGKTTLIRAMLGLEPARGRLLVDGVDITLAPSGPASRPFAWVPQDAPLVTATTVDNVALVGGRDHAREALRAVGAEDLASIDDIVGPGGRPLSGGERRLLSLARAMSTELPVLLLDEPMEGLDANAAQRVMGAIVRLRGRRSILIVTHRPEVVAIADLVVRLEEGAERRAAAE